MELFRGEAVPSPAGVLLSFPNDNPKNPVAGKSDTQNSQQKKKKLGNRVLMVGRLRELALYRAEVLRRAGFAVSIPHDTSEALRMMHSGEFDAIVLTYTLPTDIMQHLAETARECCRDCPVVAITDSILPDSRIAPDAIALANEGPPALLAALSRVLRTN
jgi:hypothetical protein